MKIFFSMLIVLFVIGVIFSACSWTTGGQESLIFPEKDVSYLLHVKPFLQQNCSYSPCHGYDFAGGISLVEYHQVISVGGFIVPNNPDGSRFVQILENSVSNHIGIHFYRGNITDNHIKGIRQWIKEGAINN
jgi:hypothetical protein